MTDKIRDALAKLQCINDDHWTAEGLPRLDVMRTLMGVTVSRAQLTQAAKLFTRSNPVLVVDTTPDAEEEVVGREDLLPAVVNGDGQASDILEDSDNAGELAGDAAVALELVDARRALSTAQERIQSANAAMDVITNRRAAANAGRTLAHDIKAYQASQNEQRASVAKYAKVIAAAMAAKERWL